MRRICAAVGVAVGMLCNAAFAQEHPAPNSAWRVVEVKDALTDAQTRMACSNLVQHFMACFSFQSDGLYASVTGADGPILDSAHFPALRVDARPAVNPYSSTLLDVERDMHHQVVRRTWSPHAWLWAPEGWSAGNPTLLDGLLTGSNLLVRAWLLGGDTVDVNYPLAGLCAALAEIAPANRDVKCPS